MPIHFFLKSEFKELRMLLIAIAILISSEKTDAILLALASTALIALLAGARIVRS